MFERAKVGAEKWYIVCEVKADTYSGPINTLAVHPEGKAYASGAEDGFVRVHWVRFFSWPVPPPGT